MQTLMQNTKYDKTKEPVIDILPLLQQRSVTAIEVCLNTGSGTFIATGTAVKDSVDKYDAEIGELLAISRALQALASGLTRRANGLVAQAEHVKMLAAQPKKPYTRKVVDGKADDRFLKNLVKHLDAHAITNTTQKTTKRTIKTTKDKTIHV